MVHLGMWNVWARKCDRTWICCCICPRRCWQAGWEWRRQPGLWVQPISTSRQSYPEPEQWRVKCYDWGPWIVKQPRAFHNRRQLTNATAASARRALIDRLQSGELILLPYRSESWEESTHARLSEAPLAGLMEKSHGSRESWAGHRWGWFWCDCKAYQWPCCGRRAALEWTSANICCITYVKGFFCVVAWTRNRKL